MAIFNSYVCLPEGTGIMEFSTRIIPNRLNVGRSWIGEMGFTLCRVWEPIDWWSERFRLVNEFGLSRFSTSNLVLLSGKRYM